ncbi:MAG: DUF3106 domain-containing protein, partial [Nevskiales bacterium]|nr:DUF3106 domain-containing protein [Nevskiales bacterium]
SGDQQVLLGGVKRNWHRLPEETQKELLEGTSRWLALAPEQQTKLRERMKLWEQMTPEQRQEAIRKREQFLRLSPEQRQQLLKRYGEFQNLPPEQQQEITARYRRVHTQLKDRLDFLMTGWLRFAAGLAFFIGLAHSILGERLVLMRLFRRKDLPRLFGRPKATACALRSAWHLTTLAWWGFGIAFILLTQQPFSLLHLLWVSTAAFMGTFVLTALVWLVFFATGLVALHAGERR